MNLICPLCSGNNIQHYYQQQFRKKPACDYYQCDVCQLVFVDPGQRLTADAEKAEYDLHENAIDDPGYRQFLSRLQEPLLQRVPAPAEGLDFGCGPGPALSAMLTVSGYSMSLYDSFYYTDAAAFDRHYDFITATEVVEHLYEPGRVLKQLWSLLPSGGLLALMTKLVIDPQSFSNWHYKNDPTHVCFFSRPTFEWLAGQWQCRLEFIGKDVILLTKT